MVKILKYLSIFGGIFCPVILLSCSFCVVILLPVPLDISYFVPAAVQKQINSVCNCWKWMKATNALIGGHEVRKYAILLYKWLKLYNESIIKMPFYSVEWLVNRLILPSTDKTNCGHIISHLFLRHLNSGYMLIVPCVKSFLTFSRQLNDWMYYVMALFTVLRKSCDFSFPFTT